MTPGRDSSAEPGRLAEPERVWVVDDSPLETTVIHRCLAPRYEVETFSDGAALIERLGNGPGPDVLVLDWQMPAVSGLEVCRFLRERFDAATLPILLLTVHSDPAQVVEGLHAGANDHVAKPFNPAELAARVGSLVHIRRLSLRLRDAEARARSLVDELERSQSQLTALLDNAPAVIYLKAPDGRMLLVNRGFERVTGVRAADIVGRTAREVFSPGGAESFDRNDARVIDSHAPVEIEEPAPLRGDSRIFRSIKFPVYQRDGSLLAVGNISLDITEQKTAIETARRERSRAEAANRAKDEFLATMSHELRTPLNAILGWAQMLRGGRLPAETQSRALETIERNARAQGQIIEDLLDVSRIITGKMRLSIESVDLAQIVEEAIDSLRLAAQAKGVRLEPRLDENAGLLLGDGQRLKQIAWNLLSNAVKFTPAEGAVRVSLRRLDDAVELRVADTGRGIRPDFLPHVFERFRQADSTTTRELGGLGLGLAIVRHLVELHGGTIQASSEGEGKGAAFTVSLPMLARNAREPSPPPPSVTEEPLPFQASATLAGLRVLLVDDEPDTRELLASVLQSCQAQVTSAASAAEALALFEAQPFDLLLSDIGMPGEDGLSLIRRIRALAAERGGQTPAVALSAYARSDDRTRALVAGFNAHVPKPVQPAELVAVVAGLARSSPPPRPRR